MNYTIDIIDVEKDNLVLSIEKALSNSIVLEWVGGDVLEEITFMPSKLSLNMIGFTSEDAQYYDLLTGDENRFFVRLYNEDNVTIWTGFLLPDMYSEPYRNSPIPVDFVASDGIGRLKGKYLPEDYYQDDKSVIDIISTCLRLTGLELDLYYSPAINNSEVDSYRNVYLDTSRYIDDDDKMNAYEIMEDIIKSQLSILRQVDNRWNVEGFNVVNSRVYTAERYDFEGIYIEDVEITRAIKQTTNIATPVIDAKPPYGIIEVSHEREDISFPDTIAEEENDGWANITKGDRFVYATNWTGSDELFAKALYKDDYKVSFGKQNNNDYISLRRRIYLRAGEKYSLKIGFRIKRGIFISNASDLADDGLWDNPFKFRLVHLRQGNIGLQTYSILKNYGNAKNIDINFDNTGTYEETFEFILNESGLLDVYLFGHEDWKDTEIDRIIISELSIEQIGFKDTYTVEQINEGYTTTYELELPISDDFTSFSNAFMLGKVNDKYDFDEFDIEIISSFQKDGFFYNQVSLEDANLVKDNLDEFYNNGEKVEDIDVIYNLFNSEQHVIKRETPLNPTGNTVKVYTYNSIREDRTYWERWTDSRYKVERKRYNEVAKDIIHRLTDKNIFQILDLQVKNNMKVNDLVVFNYSDARQWFLTNCRWDIDAGFSDVSLTEKYYAVSTGENIPPVVEAGDTIYFEDSDRSVVLNSEAYDPDGFIASYNWAKLQGTGGNILNPNSSQSDFNNLTDDYYQMEVTVTDNDGATATDTVDVMLRDKHDLILTESGGSYSKIYDVSFNPDIPAGAIINISGKFEVNVRAVDAMNVSEASFRIKSNGQYIRNEKVEAGARTGSDTDNEKDDFSVTYYNGNNLQFEIEVFLYFDQGDGEFAEGFSEFFIEEAEFVQGNGTLEQVEKNKRLDG